LSNWIRTRAQMLAAMKISSNTMTSLKRAALRGPEERPNVLRGLTAEQRQRAKDAAENSQRGKDCGRLCVASPCRPFAEGVHPVATREAPDLSPDELVRSQLGRHFWTPEGPALTAAGRSTQGDPSAAPGRRGHAREDRLHHADPRRGRGDRHARIGEAPRRRDPRGSKSSFAKAKPWRLSKCDVRAEHPQSVQAHPSDIDAAHC
jgi:hypothetical protein